MKNCKKWRTNPQNFDRTGTLIMNFRVDETFKPQNQPPLTDSSLEVVEVIEVLESSWN